MKKCFTLALFLGFLIFQSAKADTNVSGNISVDSTWSLSGSPFIVTGTIIVNEGATLSIDSGVVVRFQSNLGMEIRGALDAYKCRFTTDAANPSRGDWDDIRIGNNAQTGHAAFYGCIIEYGGHASSNNSYGMITVSRGSATFRGNNEIARSNNAGIAIHTQGTLNLSHTVISANKLPIAYTGPGSVFFGEGNNLTGNTHEGINIRFRHLNSDLLLDTVAIPYYFYSSFTIEPGHTLEIASGNIIKSSSTLAVEGTLVAAAGEGEKIYFTAYEDDNLGGDTNADGTATSPSSRDWGAIHFRASSNDEQCLLKRCRITYGGSGNHGGVIAENASPVIDSCEFFNNYFGAEFIGLSNPTFRYNMIGSSDVVPIAMSFDADPLFLNNSFSFSNNEYDAIGLLGGTLARNTILKQRDVTGIPNVTYLMLGRLTIPEAYSLTINKGIVIKGFHSNHRIVVKGALMADGEDPDHRVVITSARDDNHGNPSDTNKDGTQSDPDPGDWGGIVFEATSADTCLLSYGQFKYARMPSVHYNTRRISGGTITTVNANPTINNCIINNTDYAVYAFQASNPTLSNNEISNTRYTPVALSISANPDFSDNVFINTGQTALGLIGEELGFDGTIRLRDVAGYDSISYVLLEDLTINSGTYVDVEAGVVVKMNRNTDILINGGMKAPGTLSDTIVFTSVKDDNYGNPKDTEDDGDASSPSSGDWGNFRFGSTSDDSYNLLNHCLLLYGGNNDGTVIFSDAGGTLSNMLISDSRSYGLRCEGIASPVCSTNVEIKNCRLDPIAMSLKSDPVFSFAGMTLQSNGNGSNGIRILEGTLSSDASLIQRDVGGIYNIAYIIDRLIIEPDATLTIHPEVVIKFLRHNSYIRVNGALRSNANPGEEIIFTSLKDDSKGGDTNDDGNASNPEKGDWWCIVFNESARDTASLLNNCVLNYGGRDQSGYTNRKDYGTIRFSNSSVEVDSCRIEQSHTSAVGVYGSASPRITNCEMHNIRQTPVTMSMFASPAFSGNNVSNLGRMAIGIAQETYALDATIPKRNFAGYQNITYFIHNTCAINSGTVLTIPAGVVFKMDGIDCFNVNGAVMIKGTEEEPVVFTHEHDDDYGNPMDTNEDGDDSNPSISGNRYHLDFSDISNDTSTIRHAIFRYKQAGVNLRQASPTVAQSHFEDTHWGIILNGVSEPAVDTNTFHNLTYAPLQISLVSYPESTRENTITGSTYRTIGVVDEELVQDVTLHQKTFAGIPNIPYYFSGDYTIGTSVVLTIDPGVVLKFNDNSHVRVFRGLMARGGSTADSTIVFTSIRDDFYGGDSNSDGDATQPGGSYRTTWDGIIFDNQALDNLCQFEHCVIRHAGWYDHESAITTESASPQIHYTTLAYNSNGLRAEGASNPLINHCDIYDNRYYGVNNVNKSFTIDARYNWWGASTGPTHPGNPDGTGDAVSDMVDYSDFRGGTLNPAMGDVSLNGYIQAFDASLILQEVAQLIQFLPEQVKVADVSGEEGITAYDASLVLQYVSGSIDAFPAEIKKSFPDEPPVGNIHIEKVRETAGGEITLALTAKQVRSFSALDLELEYNPDQINLIRVEKLTLAEGMGMESNIRQEQGQVLIAMAGASELTTDGPLLLMTISTPEKSAAELSFTLKKAQANEQGIYQKPKNYTIETTAVGIEPKNEDLASLVYPNPSNGMVHLTYTVENGPQTVDIGFYDALGNRMHAVRYEQQPAGAHHHVFNLKKLMPVASEICYISVTINDQTRVHKIILH